MAKLNVIFGASGQLGSSILKCLAQTDPAALIKTLTWEEIGNLNTEALRKKLQSLGAFEGPCDFFFANGLTDPKISADRLMESNLQFPQRVVAATRNHPESRFVTFGTIFENFPEACKFNPYMRSKFELGKWMQTQAQNDPRFIHFRLHTLYGGKVAPHLFIGQMIQAIRSNSEFKMTRGDQIREYHHVDDIAFAVVKILERQQLPPMIELNSGNPLPLHQIARAVFEAFGKSELLKVGAIESPSGENTERAFPTSAQALLPRSREPIQNIIGWLRN